MNKSRILAFLTLLSLVVLFQNFTDEKNSFFPPDNRFKKMNTASGFYSEEKIVLPMEINKDELNQLSCLDFNTVTLQLRFKSQLRPRDKVKIGLFKESSKTLIQKFEENVGDVSSSCEDQDFNLMNNDELLICMPRSLLGQIAYVDLVIQSEFLTQDQVLKRILIDSSCLAMPQLIEIE